MAYERQIADLAEINWKRLAYRSVPGLKTKELVRYIEKCEDSEQQANLSFLDQFVSVANNPTGASTSTFGYVDTPSARIGTNAPKTYAGRWRLVSNSFDKANETLIQVLRLGYATTFSWDETMLAAGVTVTANQREYTVYLRNLDPSNIDTVVAGIQNTGRYTNPYVQTEQLTGTWLVSAVQPAQVQDDGSQSLSFVLTKIVTTTPESEAVHVRTTYRPESGKLELVRQWTNIDPLVADTLAYTSNANAKVLAESVASPMADGQTYGGTFQGKTVVGEKQPNQTVSIIQTLWKEGDASLSTVVGEDCGGKTYTEERWDATEAQKTAFIANSFTGPENDQIAYKWQTPESLVSKSIRADYNTETGGWHLLGIYKTKAGYAKTDLARAGTPVVDGRLTLAVNRSSLIAFEFGWQLPIADLETMAARYATHADGENKDFKITRQGDCSFDFYGTTETAVKVELAETTLKDDDGETLKVKRGKAITDADLTADYALPVAPAVGQAVERKVEKRPDALLNVEKVDSTEKALVTRESEVSSAGLKVRTTTPVVDPAAAPANLAQADAVAGKVKRRTVKEKPNNAVETVEEEETEEDEVGSVQRETQASSETVETHSASPTELSADASAVNLNTFAKNEPTGKGGYKAEKGSEAIKDQTGGKLIVTPQGTTLITEHTAAAAPLTLTATPAAGQRIEMENIPVPHGTKTREITEIPTEVPLAGPFIVEDDGMVQRSMSFSRHLASPSTANAAGKQANIDLTDLSQYNAMVEALSVYGPAFVSDATDGYQWDEREERITTSSKVWGNTLDDSTGATGLPELIPTTTHYQLKIKKSRHFTVTIQTTYSLTPATQTASGGAVTSDGGSTVVEKSVNKVGRIWITTVTTTVVADWSATTKSLTALYKIATRYVGGDTITVL